MGSDSVNQTQQFQILVAEDHLSAWIRQPNVDDPDYRPPQAADILGALEAAKIEIDDAVRERVNQFAALLAAPATTGAAGGPREIPEKFLIATGKAPVDAQDGAFEWREESAPNASAESAEDSIDYFAQHCIQTVEAGRAIGQIKPATDGVSGRSVFGNPLPPRRRHGVEIEVGDGLGVGADGREVISETAGRVVERLGKLSIEEILEINGDVSFESGSVDVCVDVNVRGTVRSRFSVRTTKSLTVGKAVEAATVDVDGDVIVRGGLCGGDANDESRGYIRAGGCVSARFCDDMIVRAGGDVQIVKETLNSRVRTTARLISRNGTIIGGDVWAREGIEVKVLGSEAGVPTRVAVGIAPEIVVRAGRMGKEIQDRIKSAQQIREKIQPLMANLKRLTPQQREMATELMSKADEMETEADALKARRDQMVAEAESQGSPHILVQGLVNPGVRLACGEREARIDQVVHGPVKFEQRKVEGVTELACVNQRTASLTVLPSTEIDLDALPAGESEPAGGTDGNDTAGEDEREG